jgi:hypothetical protein
MENVVTEGRFPPGLSRPMIADLGAQEFMDGGDGGGILTRCSTPTRPSCGHEGGWGNISA